jgi:endonuclease YncB( thermonuclease family)
VGPAEAITGDILWIHGYRIRLWGIDAPDLDTIEGLYARGQLAAFISWETVTCEVLDRDGYDRLIARCSTEYGDLAESLVYLGWARVTLETGDAYYDAYKLSETGARKACIGAWVTDPGCR